MKHDDHYHCDACGAEFRTESDLEKHNEEKHSQQASSSSSASSGDSRLNSPGIGDSRMPDPDAISSREGRDFDRSMKE